MKFIGLEVSLLTTHKIIISLTTIVITVLIYFILRTIFSKYIKDKKIRYTSFKISRYILTILSILLIVSIWAKSLGSLATFLGLVSAGITFALKDVITSIAGWLYIIIKRPFSIGDRIEIKKIKGDIIDISLLRFSLLEVENWIKDEQSTGRIVHIPNNIVFNEAVMNYTEGFTFIWNEINVLITLNSNWEKAKYILEDLLKHYKPQNNEKIKKELKKTNKKYLISYRNLTPIVYMDVIDSGIKFTLRYLINPWERRKSKNDLWEQIIKRFSQERDINLAYKTFTVYTK